MEEKKLAMDYYPYNIGITTNSNNTFGLVDYKELEKWLSYVPLFKKRRIDNILSKDVRELIPEEGVVLAEFHQEQEIVEILNRYNLGDSLLGSELERLNGYIGMLDFGDMLLSKMTISEYNKAKEISKNTSPKELERKKEDGSITIEERYALYMLKNKGLKK